MLPVGANKPGYQTSEFWLTLISQTIPVLVLLGVLGTGEAAGVEDSAKDVVETGFAFGQAAVALGFYIWSRVKVKLGR